MGIYKDYPFNLYKNDGVYNDGGIYKDGTGGDYGTVNFGGIEYGICKIGNLLWTTENLKNYTQDAKYFQDSEAYKDLGYLFTTAAIVSSTNTQSAFIENLVHDGWRVPTKDDFEKLLDVPVSSLKNDLWPAPGDNSTGFNGCPSGTRSYNGSWSNINILVMISKTLTYGGDAWYGQITDSEYKVMSNGGALVNEGQRLRSVRLCKDV